jgi:hypothetical protein
MFDRWMAVEEVAMGCCWHHHGPCWGPDQYLYGREAMMYPPRRRRFARDVAEDLRDYLQHLEGEIAAVRRELETLTARGENSG